MAQESDREQQPNAEPSGEGSSLFTARKKLYVRSTKGTFATWRWIMVWVTQLVFFGLPWVTWNDRQAVLFHLVERKFYFFGWVFWPQDVFYLALILIISAYSLFLFTAIGGRLWCGFACPQTVYTEIFMWIEEKIEGNYSKRMRLDTTPSLAGKKKLLRTLKYLAWGVFSLWTGFTLVAYFSPVTELLQEAKTLSFGPWESFWILFYGGFTFLLAGFLREQVCKYMCPYARFQSVMFDPNTLIITYDEERGEPRGFRKKGVDLKTSGMGECIDCNICVQVCPTGIDIRHGLQYECIGCAACVDACDEVMDKMGYPRGLVRYSTENAMKLHWAKKDIIGHVMRPRTVVYGLILLAIIGGFVWGLASRLDVRLDVIRDRASLGKEVGDNIENVYRLHVMNMSENERSFKLSVDGLPGISIVGNDSVEVDAATAQGMTVKVHVPVGTAEPGAQKIFFQITPTDDPDIVVREKSTFFFPR